MNQLLFFISFTVPVEETQLEPQHLVVKQEVNIQGSPHDSLDSHDSSKEHSPSPSVSKTTYTCHVCSKKYKHRNCLVKVRELSNYYVLFL